MRRDELRGEVVSVYFGGGTPSLLYKKELLSILEAIKDNFSLTESVEITLEANPEDLTPEYYQMIASKGINRLSIGIQSFQDKNLVLMNRNHQASDSIQAIKNAQEAGISTISIDLIYGIQGLSQADWIKNLNFR